MRVGWHPSLASGDDEIDGQHQEIVRRLAELVEALEGERLDEIGGLFQHLGDYMVAHFASEERAMERSGYPGRTVHAAAHARFVRQYAELRALYEQAGPSFAIKVKTSTWIQDWLASHIHGADRALVAHLREARQDGE